MATLKELLQKRQDLDKQIAAAKEPGFAVAITDVRQLISHFGVTATDLEIVPRGENLETKRPVGATKYRDPESGSTWSGRGKAPRWIAGKNRDDFLI